MIDGQETEVLDEAVDWIDVRVRMASTAKPVAEKTALLLKAAMRSKMADRQLPSGELAKLAREMLATLGSVAK